MDNDSGRIREATDGLTVAGLPEGVFTVAGRASAAIAARDASACLALAAVPPTALALGDAADGARAGVGPGLLPDGRESLPPNLGDAAGAACGVEACGMVTCGEDGRDGDELPPNRGEDDRLGLDVDSPNDRDDEPPKDRPAPDEDPPKDLPPLELLDPGPPAEETSATARVRATAVAIVAKNRLARMAFLLGAEP